MEAVVNWESIPGFIYADMHRYLQNLMSINEDEKLQTAKRDADNNFQATSEEKAKYHTVWKWIVWAPSLHRQSCVPFRPRETSPLRPVSGCQKARRVTADCNGLTQTTYSRGEFS